MWCRRQTSRRSRSSQKQRDRRRLPEWQKKHLPLLLRHPQRLWTWWRQRLPRLWRLTEGIYDCCIYWVGERSRSRYNCSDAYAYSQDVVVLRVIGMLNWSWVRRSKGVQYECAHDGTKCSHALLGTCSPLDRDFDTYMRMIPLHCAEASPGPALTSRSPGWDPAERSRAPGGRQLAYALRGSMSARRLRTSR